MTKCLSKLVKWSVAVLVALLMAAQLIPVERTNPPVQSDVQAPVAVKSILVKACYDCHSHETRWPWYSRIAPVSWWVAEHVRDGRKDLNFSTWPTYDFTGQAFILQEIEKQVSSGAMPLSGYAIGHPAARLTPAERQTLLEWARSGLAADEDLMR